jgi:predicted NUDIX family NTP pyrophosphohydrolase
VLLVLPRSARGSGSCRGVWSIPKGKPLPSERLIDAARREFEEETARPAPPRLVELGEVVEPTGKRIAVWAADAAWSPSVDLANGHRPAAEIAEVAWFDADQARAMLRPGQTQLLGRIDRLVRRASS